MRRPVELWGWTKDSDESDTGKISAEEVNQLDSILDAQDLLKKSIQKLAMAKPPFEPRPCCELPALTLHFAAPETRCRARDEHAFRGGSGLAHG